ncbi:hypothetical protein PAPYR_9480 [Paratrimastix pyriformis]|uniref:Uncharacterized protein n=1 Tax=Paratrimastix pyriformis TaxID=342808 RepID=A0ABQ8UCZ2_9EUKA|nr:hypothetical protein PAPYR_9480 [Paratrimastix pyriformis]
MATQCLPFDEFVEYPMRDAASREALQQMLYTGPPEAGIITFQLMVPLPAGPGQDSPGEMPLGTGRINLRECTVAGTPGRPPRPSDLVQHEVAMADEQDAPLGALVISVLYKNVALAVRP